MISVYAKGIDSYMDACDLHMDKCDIFNYYYNNSGIVRVEVVDNESR
jgi:hypothetical protein